MFSQDSAIATNVEKLPEASWDLTHSVEWNNGLIVKFQLFSWGLNNPGRIGTKAQSGAL